MIFYTGDNPLAKLHCWIRNKTEKYRHWYWNKKPHHVTCKICGDTIHSGDDRLSPEERGWVRTEDGNFWICHTCIFDRDFKSYAELADIDYEISWNEYLKNLYGDDRVDKELKQEKRELLQEMLDETEL